MDANAEWKYEKPRAAALVRISSQTNVNAF